MRRSGAEIALSLGVVALGIGIAAVTATLPSEGGYAGSSVAEALPLVLDPAAREPQLARLIVKPTRDQ